MLLGAIACGPAKATAPLDMTLDEEVADLLPVEAACDEVTQTGCTDPTRSKCSSADDTMTNVGVPTCVPTFGNVPKDGVCKRQCGIEGCSSTILGYDDCAPGAYCSGFGTLNSDSPNRHCRAFCRSDADCGTPSQKCMVFDLAIEPVGICVPTCMPFGSDCPSGYGCATVLDDLIDAFPGSRIANLSYSCRTAGKVALGLPCPNGDQDCVADAVCFDPTAAGVGVCTALCDVTHPCAAGLACKLSVSLPGKEFTFEIPAGGWCL